MDRAKILQRLAVQPAKKPLSETAKVVVTHRRLILKAMRMGHSLQELSSQLQLPKRTLQRHINAVGLFWRKPRSQKGRVVKQNLAAIKRAKMEVAANV